MPTSGPEVEWALFRGTAVPSSDTHGPARVIGDVARCYSRTPTGALIAMVQISSRYLVSPDGVSIAREQTIPGKGQDVLVAALERRGEVEVQSGDVGQIAAYRFVNFTPDEAVIAVATRGPDGGLQLVELRVRWSEGDWKIVLFDDGSQFSTSSTLTDLTGMNPWSGV